MTNFQLESSYRLKLKEPTPAPGFTMDVVGPGTWRVYKLAEKFCKGTGLDVGGAYYLPGSTRGFPGATVVDITIPGSGNALDLAPYHDSSQDYVLHSHTLEHVADPELAIAEAHRVLKPNGVLFLYLPFPGHFGWDPLLDDAVRGVHKWQPDPSAVNRLLLMADFRVVYAEWDKDPDHGFLTIAKK